MLHIHPATNSDVIRAAMNLYIESEDRLHGWLPGKPPIPHNTDELDSIFKHWLALYESTPDGFIIAEDDEHGKIVGVAGSIRRPPQWILNHFYVHADYQGRGIGRQLLQAAFATREGCTRFCVHASSDPAAQTLYMKFGMFPQPPSVRFKGQMRYNIAKPKHVTMEKVIASEATAEINRIDQSVLGFERPTDHIRWATDGYYYLAHTKDANHPFAYFRVAASGHIGPVVVTQVRWQRAILEMALMAGQELSAEQHLLVPGANAQVIERLLAYGYRYQESNFFLSNVPMPELAQIIFFEEDFL